MSSESVPQVRVVRFELATSTIITVLLLGVGVWLSFRLLPVLLLCIAALIIVASLSPTVSWLETKRLPRGWAIALVFTVLTICSVLMVGLTVPAFLSQVSSLVDHEPAIRADLVTRLDRSSLTEPLAEALRTIDYGTLLHSFGASAFSRGSLCSR